MKQISIIIPTYNMEKYIDKCLDSLLIPEIDDVEVWVVNDGSKDRSSEIAHEYAAKYPQSINVIDKENGNYGSCINAALPKCTGRYVKVLDADDTFDTEAFSEFVRVLNNHNEDVLVTNFVIVDSEGNPTRFDTFATRGYSVDKSYSFEDAYNYICDDIHMHAIAYRCEMLIDMNYHQTEGVSYTDSEWVYSPISMAKEFAFINCGYLYRYLIGRDGQTVDPSMNMSRIVDHLEGLKTQIHIYESNKSSGIRQKYLETQISMRIKRVYTMVIEAGKERNFQQIAEFDMFLKGNSKRIYDITNDINYRYRLNYKFIKDLREKDFSPSFKINRLILIQGKILSFASKLKNAICR